MNEDLLKTGKRKEKRHRQGQEDEIMEFQRLGRFYWRYTKKKELGWKENLGIQYIGVEDYKGNITADKTQIMKNWENYITDTYDRPKESQLQTK
jgi:hypothetical protein